MGSDGRPCRAAPARAPGRRPRVDRHRRRAGGGRRAAAADAQWRARGAQRARRLGEGAMILAIDAGNSRVKWGWHDGTAWSSIATVSLIEFAASSDHVNPFSVTHDDPERIIISRSEE